MPASDSVFLAGQLYIENCVITVLNDNRRDAIVDIPCLPNYKIHSGAPERISADTESAQVFIGNDQGWFGSLHLSPFTPLCRYLYRIEVGVFSMRFQYCFKLIGCNQ